MKSLRIYISGLFLLLPIQIMLCQKNAKITNVDFSISQDKIVVLYNIVDASPDASFTIDLKFVTDKNEIIKPKTVSGDVGKNVKVVPSNSKVIFWDIAKDQVEISGTMKAVVTILSSGLSEKVVQENKKNSTVTKYRGPEYALLSVLAPGLGGYFVDKNKTRAIATSASSLGLIIYGLIQKGKANKYYSDYKASLNPNAMDDLYNKANSAHHRYYIATRLGAAIWISDIVWVVFKGIHNRKVALNKLNALNDDGLKIIYADNGLQLSYVYRF